MTRRRLEFDVVLDAWPDHIQGQALHSLITSGDVIAVQLPYGFAGLITVSSPMLMHRDEGQLPHQANPPDAWRAPAPVPAYRYPVGPPRGLSVLACTVLPYYAKPTSG